MKIIPIKTPLLKDGDDLIAALTESAEIKSGDIIVVSSKAVATVEGAAIDLTKVEVSDEAQAWVKKLNRVHPAPSFRQAILEEAKRLNGDVVGNCLHAMLTELKPNGLEEGTVLAANAGLDRSNTPVDTAIGWPVDPLESVGQIREDLKVKAEVDELAVIISDSCCRPRRLGVTAIALTISGLEPFVSHIGKEDLFHNPLHFTQEATADQLATAANFVMGNAAESIPAAIIRDHGLELSDFEGWVPGIEPGEDLFKGVL